MATGEVELSLQEQVARVRVGRMGPIEAAELSVPWQIRSAQLSD